MILFGSYAYGLPSEGSDIDLFIVMSNSISPHEKAAEILLRLHPEIPVELVIRTPEQIAERLGWNDFFLQDILEKARCCMNPLTSEWIEKAEGDFTVAKRSYARVAGQITMPSAFTHSNAQKNI